MMLRFLLLAILLVNVTAKPECDSPPLDKGGVRGVLINFLTKDYFNPLLPSPLTKGEEHYTFVGYMEPTTPSEGVWLDVPFVAQEPKGCGAAVISMVMSYWSEKGFPAEAETRDAELILRSLKSEEQDGILASDLEEYFRKHQYRVFAFRGSTQDLEHHLLKGRPLIVALQPDGKNGPRHYVVAAGFSHSEKVIVINDPAQRKLMKINREKFEDSWKGTGFWTLLAVPES